MKNVTTHVILNEAKNLNTRYNRDSSLRYAPFRMTFSDLSLALLAIGVSSRGLYFYYTSQLARY